MDWYLAPAVRVVVDADKASVQVGDGGGSPVIVGGMVVHIGLVHQNPTECVVGVPVGAAVPSDWRRMSPDEATTAYERLFGRRPDNTTFEV